MGLEIRAIFKTLDLKAATKDRSKLRVAFEIETTNEFVDPLNDALRHYIEGPVVLVIDELRDQPAQGDLFGVSFGDDARPARGAMRKHFAEQYDEGLS